MLLQNIVKVKILAAKYCKSQDSFKDEVPAKVCSDEVIGELDPPTV
jgi:hypothetical protein